MSDAIRQVDISGKRSSAQAVIEPRVGPLAVMDCSNATIRDRDDTSSMPSSPRSSALPSPPDSPSLDSVSSLPSVSSSFFFSSSAAGSPRLHSDTESRATDPEHALIIPSLTLPSALRHPTPFGQTMGELRLLVLGGHGAGKSFLTGLLLEDNEHVVEVGTWEDAECGEGAKVLRASTDWHEMKDNHGLDRYEPMRNVEIVEFPGYHYTADGDELIAKLRAIIEEPFHTLSQILHPNQQPSAVLAHLLSAPTTPLYTALIFLLPSPPTPLDQFLISSLAPHLPVIVLPQLSGPRRPHSTPKLSSWKPINAVSLRNGLFHSPETLALLRSEATDRFLRWREIERSLGEREHVWSPTTEKPKGGWNKVIWEMEWMEDHSYDVALARRRREREGTITQRARPAALWDVHDAEETPQSSLYHRPHQHPDFYEPKAHRDQPTSYCTPATFDPLHLPSLLLFSLSLLGPLKARIGKEVMGFVHALAGSSDDEHAPTITRWYTRVALVGGFCLGVGVGVLGR